MRGFGFTLIELLIVITIMVTLVAMMVPRFTRFTRLQTLQNAALDLQTVFRIAQNNATSGVRCDESGAPVNGWAIRFVNGDTYQLEKSCNSQLTPTPSPVISTTYQLPGGIAFKAVSLGNNCKSGGCCEVNPADARPAITFANITGEVAFGSDISCPVGSGSSEMMITLESNSDDSSETAYVTVKKGGSIFVESD